MEIEKGIGHGGGGGGGGENGGSIRDPSDDGRIRTGTFWTASAHIITAVIGSGVLSLAWCIAQLGWIAGPIFLGLFSLVTWYTSALLSDCYRSPHPVTGKRNYNYMEAVKANLGGIKFQICGIAQYANLVGITIGFTITTAISMAAINRSNCFHKAGHTAGCHTFNNRYMIIFGIIQMVFSQVPNFHKLSPLSFIAATMSFAYSSIGIGLSIAKVVGGGARARTSITGVPVGNGVSSSDKLWNTFSALGNIAFAYSFSIILIEIQDTLKSSPPENQVMKRAALAGISVTTVFYMLCGMLGYAAFGNDAPGNFLTGFGFYDPFWLIDFANVCIIVHLIGAYQVCAQPVFSFVETWTRHKWPENKFINQDYPIMGLSVNLFRLMWRTLYVVFTTTVAALFPFFNDFVGLLGAAGFWPLTVYFPIEMYISQKKIRKFSMTWVWMQILSLTCLIISVLAAAGSIRGLLQSLKAFKPFKSYS